MTNCYQAIYKVTHPFDNSYYGHFETGEYVVYHWEAHGMINLPSTVTIPEGAKVHNLGDWYKNDVINMSLFNHGDGALSLLHIGTMQYQKRWNHVNE